MEQLATITEILATQLTTETRKGGAHEGRPGDNLLVGFIIW